MDARSKIVDCGLWIVVYYDGDEKTSIVDRRSSMMRSGFWILDSGFWILDSGFWILDSGSDRR